MKNDYLWDGSAEPDPEIQCIEKLLGQFRYSGKTPDFAAVDSLQRRPSPLALLFSAWTPRFAAATLLIFALVASGFLLRLSHVEVSNVSGWDVARLAGAPRVGRLRVVSDSGTTQLKVGQRLVTDERSRAAVSIADIGQFEVDPDSRVRLIETGLGRERLALELGTIHAVIWAPPGKFVVETPSATAVDLGCAYVLRVNADGSGSLHTTIGWVGFHKDGHDSFVPAGAMCTTRPRQGPGTPHFEDASETFRNALRTFDFESMDAEKRQEVLRMIVLQARPKDAFTLWHLLFRVSGEERPLVYDRLTRLVTPPAGVTREGTLALNSQMMDAWWNAFELGDISIWRYWEQKQAPPMLKKTPR